MFALLSLYISIIKSICLMSPSLSLFLFFSIPFHINLHRNYQQLMFTDSPNQVSVLPGGSRSLSTARRCVCSCVMDKGGESQSGPSWEQSSIPAITTQSKCDLFPKESFQYQESPRVDERECEREGGRSLSINYYSLCHFSSCGPPSILFTTHPSLMLSRFIFYPVCLSVCSPSSIRSLFLHVQSPGQGPIMDKGQIYCISPASASKSFIDVKNIVKLN